MIFLLKFKQKANLQLSDVFQFYCKLYTLSYYHEEMTSGDGKPDSCYKKMN